MSGNTSKSIQLNSKSDSKVTTSTSDKQIGSFGVDNYSVRVTINTSNHAYKRYPYLSGYGAICYDEIIDHKNHVIDRLALLQIGSIFSTANGVTISLFPVGKSSKLESRLAFADCTNHPKEKVWKVEGTTESGKKFTCKVDYPEGKSVAIRNHFANIVKNVLPRLSVNFGNLSTTVTNQPFVEFIQALTNYQTLSAKFEKSKLTVKLLEFKVNMLTSGNPEKAKKLASEKLTAEDDSKKLEDLVKSQIVTIRTTYEKLTAEEKSSIDLEELGFDQPEVITSSQFPSKLPTK